MAIKPDLFNGTSVFSPGFGQTPFGTYDNQGTYNRDIESTAIWCARRLGYPTVEVELSNNSLFTCYEEAVTEYGAQVNRFNMRENLLAAKGNSTASNFTHKNILPNQGRLIALSKQYGAEAGSGGNVEWKSGFIETTANQQEYDLSALWAEVSESGKDIEIKRVFHQSTPASKRSSSPQFGSHRSLNSFGWGGTMAGVSFLSMPIYDDMLRIQQVEFSDTVRRSMYSFELINNKLKIHPVPRTSFKYHFQYIVTSDRSTLITDNGVSDFSNMKYDNMTYGHINDPGKQWIRKYALALSKTLLGQIRGKFTSIPIPGGDVSVDGDALRNEGAAEQEILISQLREDLDAVSRRNMMERENEVTDFQQNMLNKNPLNIYIG